MPKFHKIDRGARLSLFVLSSIASYFNPHMLYIAGLSILGVIAYDVVCFLKERHGKDYGPEIKELAARVEVAEHVAKEIRNDASIGKLAETFRRK